MATVQIRGLSVELDEEDISKVLARNWSIHWAPKPYLSTSDGVQGKRMFIHRFILGLSRGDGKIVDHIDGDTLNNRKTNLRICTAEQNTWNRKMNKTNTTGYTGVWFNRRINRWRASIGMNGKHVCLGHFKTIEEAGEAYEKAAKEHRGEFVRADRC